MITYEMVKAHKQKYEFMHIGLIEVADKPLIKKGLDMAILLYLRDSKLTNFLDSLIVRIETSLCEVPIYFNSYTDLLIKFKDKNILKSMELDIKFHVFNLLPGLFLAVVIYRICFKIVNSLDNVGVINKNLVRKTIFFQANLDKRNVHVPKTLIWDQVTLPKD